MRTRLLSLLLLLVFGGSLFATPHPCRVPEAAPDPGQEKKPACHGQEAASPEGPSAASSEQKGDCCAGEHGNVCEHACHMVALVRVPASMFVVQPKARMVVLMVDRSLPLFAPPIDHVPLG